MSSSGLFRNLRALLISSTVAAIGFTASSASANLIINPTYDPSILNDSNSVAIIAGISAAITQVQDRLLNNVIVNIAFKGDESIGLGQSSTSYGGTSYTQYRAGLMNQQTLSTSDNTAIATLPAGPNNPVNANTGMSLTTPLLRVIGESAAGSNGGGLDSTISFKLSLMNYVRTGPQDMAKYDLEQVALHEIAEVLGAGGGGSTIGDPGTDIGTLDLFRYSASGVRSHSTAAPTAYFSIDGGATNLSFFNQSAGGDYADWDGGLNPNAQVQDAFSAPGNQLNLSTAELTALDVVGWTVAVPEPTTTCFLSLAALALLRRQRPSRSSGSDVNC